MYRGLTSSESKHDSWFIVGVRNEGISDHQTCLVDLVVSTNPVIRTADVVWPLVGLVRYSSEKSPNDS